MVNVESDYRLLIKLLLKGAITVLHDDLIAIFTLLFELLDYESAVHDVFVKISEVLSSLANVV